MNLVTKPVARGFTLAEMMLTLALVGLIYTMISGILIQVARYVKSGRQTARERQLLLVTVEELRYQLRSLYIPPESSGLIGQKTPLTGRDNLRFLTSNGKSQKGAVEVAYWIQDRLDAVDPKDNGPTLYYREFPFRIAEFRTFDPYPEAPWSIKLANVDVFELQYSAAGGQWQREWDAPGSPSRIRVRIERGGQSNDKMTFDVTPGVGAKRW